MSNGQDYIMKKKLHWPILAGDYLVGNPEARIAVMTCGSYDLPKRILESRADKIAISGFCETENEGLARIVQNIVSNPHIRHMIVCGDRVRGHEPGQTIIALHSNGVDEKYTVIGSKGTIPTLLPTYFRGDNPSKYIKRFQQQLTTVVDMTDETSVEKIGLRIDALSIDNTPSFEMGPLYPPQPRAEYDWNRAVSSYMKRTRQQGVKPSSLGPMSMYTDADLQIYDLCGVKVGGQRGENPTVMAGTIFYTKDKTVMDARSGNFSKDIAADLIYKQDELSLYHSIPVMVHIVGQTVEAIERYLLFTVDHTDSPIIIDSSSADVRVHGISLAKDIGVEDRAIYNSVIIPSKEERDALASIGGVKYAIFLSYTESAQDSIQKAKESIDFFGKLVEKPIIDPGVPKLGGGALTAIERAWFLKDQIGCPTAIGIHNLHSSLKNIGGIAFNFDYTLPTLFGVDVNLYGPIRNAEEIFPNVAGSLIAVADECHKTLGVLPREPHPYYNLFNREGITR